MFEQTSPIPVAQTDVESRATFIGKTYQHLLMAIFGFTALEFGLWESGLMESIYTFAVQTNWLLILGGFMIAASMARTFARSNRSIGTQYAALVAYVVAEALLFAPMLYLANNQYDGVISSAATVTLIGFIGLTAIVFATRKDFSFMRAALMWIGFGALGLIVASVLFGFALGTAFSVAMVVFAGGTILYNTSNILHHYPEDAYVGASIDLFASVALMFWYVLRLFMGSRR